MRSIARLPLATGDVVELLANDHPADPGYLLVVTDAVHGICATAQLSDAELKQFGRDGFAQAIVELGRLRVIRGDRGRGDRS